ncbi:GGDEF domain-containing protein [Aliikangiella coralliicola]|nr:GGDEF domain-containing protein [Aliikangiella coralliicola]
MRFILVLMLAAVIMTTIFDYAAITLLGQSYRVPDFLAASISALIITYVIARFFVGKFFDIDELEKEMHRLATYDDLTGLLNRNAFMQASIYYHELQSVEEQNYSVLAIDIDFFKRINDQYGHAAGDKALIEFGRVSKEISRASDILGRLGGEEFVFLLPETNVSQAKSFAERLMNNISELKITEEDSEFQFTISIGITAPPHKNSTSLETLIKKADEALYSAKNSGRNKISIYTNNLEQNINTSVSNPIT